MYPKDFLAKQIRLTQAIASGSFPNAPDLMIYRRHQAPDYDGTIPFHISDGLTAAALGGPTSNLAIGPDVWLYVDHAEGPNFPIGGTGGDGGTRGDNSVVLFAGDVVVSGTLWSERHVMEVTEVNITSEKYEGDMILSGNLFVQEKLETYNAPGSNQWIDFQSEGGTSLFVVDSVNERVGIHTANPLFDLHIIDDRALTARLGLLQYSDDSAGDGADIMIQRARGNLLTGMSGIVDGDRIGSIYFQGAAGTTAVGPGVLLGDNQIAAGISAVVQGDPGTGNGEVPAFLGLRTGDATTGGDLKYRLAAAADGRIGIGGHTKSATGRGQLHIMWSDASGGTADALFDPTPASVVNMVGESPLVIEGLQEGGPSSGGAQASKNLMIDETGAVVWGMGGVLGYPCETELCDPNPTDQTYSDGLFMDWEPTTPIGCAVDRMNEVLGQMAPQPAPLANSLSEGSEQQVVNETTPLTFAEYKGGKLPMENNTYWGSGMGKVWGTTAAGANSGLVGPTGMLGGPDLSSSAERLFGYLQSSDYPDPEDRREATAPTEHEHDHRMGFFYGSEAGGNTGMRPTFKCTINFDDAQDPDAGPPAEGMNYPQGAFGRGDQGTLELLINGVTASTLLLAGQPATDLTTSDANNTGATLAVGPLFPAHFDNGEDLCTYYHRDWGTMEFNGQHMRLGWNWARAVHTGTSAAGPIFSSIVTWIMDEQVQEPIIAQQTPGTRVSNETHCALSGVEYLTGADVAYTYTIQHAYRSMYYPDADGIVWTDNSSPGNALIIPAPQAIDQFVPPVNVFTSISSSALHGATLSLKTPTCAGASWRMGESIDLRVTVRHPWDDDNIGPNSDWGPGGWVPCSNAEVDNGWSETFLIYNTADSGNSCDTDAQDLGFERFRTEKYRVRDSTSLAANDYDDQSDASSPGNEWNPLMLLNTGGNNGYEGLMCFDGTLRSPSNTAGAGTVLAASNGNFQTVDYPNGSTLIIGQQPDYSGYINGTQVRTFYRKFSNTEAGSEEGWRLLIDGGDNMGAGAFHSDIVPTAAGTGAEQISTGGLYADAQNIHVEIKVPEDLGVNSGTGWLDCAKEFTGGLTDGFGTLVGSYTPPTTSTDSHRVHTNNDADFKCTLGSGQVVNTGDYIIMRVTAREDWPGTLNSIEIDWDYTG